MQQATQSTNITALLFFASSLVLTSMGLVGCSSADSGGKEKVIVVPSTATSAPPYRGDGSPPPRRYVVRMSDGQRDWEVEFPESANGYQLRIPIDANDKAADGVLVEGDELTAADKEMLESLRRRNVGMEREGIYKDGRNQADPDGRNQVGGSTPGNDLGDADGSSEGTGGIDPWAGTEDQPAPTRQSYFKGIENVKRLYRAGRYEMAIIYLKELEQDYPNDPKLLSMMGTLYLKVGQEELARDYWERVLQIDPTNKTVIEALKQLNQRGAGSRAPRGNNANPAPQPEPNLDLGQPGSELPPPR